MHSGTQAQDLTFSLLSFVLLELILSLRLSELFKILVCHLKFRPCFELSQETMWKEARSVGSGQTT